MQKSPETLAEVYMTRPRFTPLDVTALICTVLALICFVVFWFTLWLSLPVLAFFMLFLISYSDHVSDKDYEQALTHLLQFNTVREARSDGYEALLKFHEQGYLKKDFKEEFTDFYISGYDLCQGLAKFADDREPRSTVYRLTHLHFTKMHCLYHTCEADLIAGTVTEDRRIVPFDEGAEITAHTVTLGRHTVTARYLVLPYCAPIPVGEKNAELEEILSHFTKK